MEYRHIGATGVVVSELGFGASPLGNVFGEIDAREGIQAVHDALDRGITLFDVSPYYGATLAEEMLGRALRGRRDEAVLSTKAGRNGLNDFDFSAGAMRRSVEASLRRLQTDHVDILFAHDVEFDHPERVLGETYETLRALKQEGLCRAIGMSGLPLLVLRRAIEACDLDVVISYCHGTLWDDTLLSDLLPVAERRGTAVINGAALGIGLLTEAGPPPWHPAPQVLKDAARHAVAACAARGAALPPVALGWSVRIPGVVATLTGIKTPAEVIENLTTLAVAPDPAALAAAREALAPVHNITWPSGNEEAWATRQ